MPPDRPHAPVVPARRLGRLAPLERAQTLCDPDTFRLEGPAPSALLTGLGTLADTPIAVIASDGRAHRGTLGPHEARRATALIRRAIDHAHPVVLLLDSDGARLTDGADAIATNAELLATLALARDTVPTLCAIFGAAGGSAAYAAALCDLRVAVAERSFAFVAGPEVTAAALSEPVTLDQLGTPLHEARSGLLHASAPDDLAALTWLRHALLTLPRSVRHTAPRVAPRPPGTPTPLSEFLPPTGKPYDAHALLAHFLDRDSPLPLGPAFGPSIQVGLGRLDGCALAWVASQPLALAGAIDAAAAQKLARFVDFATARRLPLLTLCDTPGFLPGPTSEAAGILAHGAAVIRAYAAAHRQVPTLALVVRRAVGAGVVLIAGAALTLALPGAEIVQMGDPAGRAMLAVQSLLPPTAPPSPAPSPSALETGLIHRVIAPDDARAELARALGHLLTR